jgi:hypothetical protein
MFSGRPFDGDAARKRDDARPRRDRVRDAVEPMRGDDHDIDDAAGVLAVAPALRRRLHHVAGAVQIGVDHRVPALESLSASAANTVGWIASSSSVRPGFAGDGGA